MPDREAEGGRPTDRPAGRPSEQPAPVRPAQGRLWNRVGLRGRVTLLFGLGAFVLSVVMGGLSYFSARHFLLADSQNGARQQAYANAQLVLTQLEATQSSPAQIVDGLDQGVQAHSVLVVDGAPYDSSFLVGLGVIPRGLQRMVASGTPASQNFVLNNSPRVVVGVPVPAVKAAYYEVFDLADLARTLHILALALAAGGVVTTALGFAVGRTASARSLRPLSGVSQAAVLVAGGELGTRLPDASDDPDLRGLTTSFNQMVDQLQERIEREERFTSDVSHELRSPLTTLAASMEVLEAHADELSPPARQALVLLGDDLRRFQRMVADLLEISRTDAGSVELALEEVDAAELVRRAVAAGSRLVQSEAPVTIPPGPAPSGPEVTIDPGLTGVRLMVDKRRFERVMANLLENAAFYGGGATRVTASRGAAGAGGWPTVRIAVEDHGPGVAPAERAKVFARFYRGQASGRRGAGTGTGLGLALVAEHVRLHRGRVWVEEADGGGARFVIELPVSAQRPAPSDGGQP
jgi:signal transduction histidine kinase